MSSVLLMEEEENSCDFSLQVKNRDVYFIIDF